MDAFVIFLSMVSSWFFSVRISITLKRRAADHYSAREGVEAIISQK